MAAALCNITVAGPSKTTNDLGPTNSGKSLVLPFDDVFGFANVFHKPALNSFAFRNILKQNGFLFWQPAIFGQKIVLCL